MDLCPSKQKAFAQRVYFDLKICRKWSKLHVYYDATNKWIFFLGKQSDDQPLVFVLPISNDEQLTIDELFNLKSKLSLAVPSNITESIQSVLVAIIANDFTLGYFNFSFGLPSFMVSNVTQAKVSTNEAISTIDYEFTNEMQNETPNYEWTMTSTDATWD